MARAESRKSLGVFAVLYIGLAAGALIFFTYTLKPAFDRIGADDPPAASQTQESEVGTGASR